MLSGVLRSAISLPAKPVAARGQETVPDNVPGAEESSPGSQNSRRQIKQPHSFFITSFALAPSVHTNALKEQKDVEQTHQEGRHCSNRQRRNACDISRSSTKCLANNAL